MGKMFEVLHASNEVPKDAVLTALFDVLQERLPEFYSTSKFEIDTLKIYQNLVSEIARFEKMQFELWKAEGDTPAWRFVYHVLRYLKESADCVMRYGIE